MRTTKNRQIVNANDFRVWRFETQKTLPSPYYIDLPASTAYQMIFTYNLTLEEISAVKVNVACEFVTNLVAARRICWIGRITLDGSALVTHPKMENRQDYDASGWNIIPHNDQVVFEEVGAGSHTIIFEVREMFQVAVTRRVQTPAMEIDICRT